MSSFEDKSKVGRVLFSAYNGSVVDKHTVAAAIREFEGILDDLARQPPKEDMVTVHKNEVDKMKEIIKYQDKKISEMSDSAYRLNLGYATDWPLVGVADQTDVQRRYDLADRFRGIYDCEWQAAYEELMTTMRWRNLECIYALMRVIRNACDLCLNLAEDQMDRLLVGMEDCMISPLNGNGKFKKAYQKSSGVYTDGMKEAEKFVRVYRKERADASVPAVIELFNETKLRAIIRPYDAKKHFQTYIRKCVEVIWLMTTLEPPMRLFWQQQNDRVNEDFFTFYDRRGEHVNQTVWPAVFLHNSGVLLHKGKMLAV